MTALATIALLAAAGGAEAKVKPSTRNGALAGAAGGAVVAGPVGAVVGGVGGAIIGHHARRHDAAVCRNARGHAVRCRHRRRR
jgi:hypothetical protein